MACPHAMASFAFAVVFSAACAHGHVGCPRTVQLLQQGRETVRIVCFGDSITGVYYHSGAARAWCEMLGIGLKRLYPQAKLEMINAGVSSQNTRHALQRIQSDVLERRPTVVVVSFGMNDVRGANPIPSQESRDNQAQIVRLCKRAGAEVVLCTPNSIYPGLAEWPAERLGPYAELVRDVGAQEGVPVADVYRAFEDIRAKDCVDWMLLMSEWIHPNMNGHKVIAQEVIRAMTGHTISLRDVPPPFPAIPFTLEKLAKGDPVKVIAMEPYDKMIGGALRQINPNARLEVTAWPVPHRSIAKIAESAAGIRQQRPDLVVVAVPATANAPTREWFIRHYNEIYNQSVSYATREFDCIGILPSVLTPNLAPAARRRHELARQIIRGHDLEPIERKPGDTSSAAQILRRWLRAQADNAPKEVDR